MKRRILKSIAFMLVLMLVLPLLTFSNVSVASAKRKDKKVKYKTVTIDKSSSSEQNGTFVLNLENLDSKFSSIYWYSQNEKVATVKASSNKKTAVVTTLRKGTTHIKAKITYKDGTVVSPSYKVTVKSSVTDIEINNAKENSYGKHIIEVGDSYNFNTKYSPKNAKTNTYWSISNSDIAKVDSKGIVKGLKPGDVILTATAAESKDYIASSNIKDIVQIQIITPIDDDDDCDHDHDDDYDDDHDDDDDCDHNHDDDNNTVSASVKSVTLEEATKLSITFDKAMNSSTIIGANNTLLGNLIITPKVDANGIAANPLGNITAYLSSDGKILTLQTTNIVKGLYNIKLTSAIKTAEGKLLKEYSQDLSLFDTKKPEYKGWTLDQTGLIITFNFSEAMDFTNMIPANAKVINNGQPALPTTINLLNTKAYYVPSADKKSLTLNLTNQIPTVDQNKTFEIMFYALKDLSGNAMVKEPITTAFNTDTTYKPQAKVETIKRTDINTLTATFNRQIRVPGQIIVNNTELSQGVIDANDNKKVNYTLSATSAQLTGYQKVLIGYWDGYNVSPEDSTGKTYIEYYVDFSENNVIPLAPPVSITQSLDNTNIINIYFNNLLDKSTAENKANYSIAGVTIATAELTNYTNSASVKLTIQPNTIATSQTYLFTISGIKGYNNSYKAMNSYQTTVPLNENISPTLISYKYYYPTTILLTFSEPIKGTASFRAKQKDVDLVQSSVVNNSSIIITLKSTPEMYTNIDLIPTEYNQITDLAGNKTTSILNRSLLPTP